MKALMIPIIAFIVCFSLAGGAGAYLLRPDAVADSTQADSSHADTTAVAHGTEATLEPNDAEPDSVLMANDPHAADPSRTASPATTEPGSTATAGTTAGTTSAPAPGSLPTVASSLRSSAGTTVSLRADGSVGSDRPASEPNYERLASLLSKMGAREAARTLEQLAPNDAARALSAMTDKQAALVLAQLAPEKSAALLQAVLAMMPRTTTP